MARAVDTIATRGTRSARPLRMCPAFSVCCFDWCCAVRDDSLVEKKKYKAWLPRQEEEGAARVKMDGSASADRLTLRCCWASLYHGVRPLPPSAPQFFGQRMVAVLAPQAGSRRLGLVFIDPVFIDPLRWLGFSVRHVPVMCLLHFRQRECLRGLCVSDVAVGSCPFVCVHAFGIACNAPRQTRSA